VHDSYAWFTMQNTSHGSFVGDKHSMNEILYILAQDNLWKGSTVPHNFIKTVFLAVLHQLLQQRRARLLCDAYAAGQVGVVQIWRVYEAAGTLDVPALLVQLRGVELQENNAHGAVAVATKCISSVVRTDASSNSSTELQRVNFLVPMYRVRPVPPPPPPPPPPPQPSQVTSSLR
jgi:hypothetical protein